MRVLVGLQVAQVDAVHPVELLVVERRRARADALELEPLDQLAPRHDRRLVVVAPAEQREEVEERRRQVAVRAEVVERPRVALRQLAAVVAVDVRHVGVTGRSAPSARRMLICVGVFETWSSPRITWVIPSITSSTGEMKL